MQQVKEADSDISDSDASDRALHFQCEHGAFQFTQVEHEFEPRIAQLFKQAFVRNDSKLVPAAGTRSKLDLREVILLDSQSTMDLICNRALVSKTFNASQSMRLKSNGGTMVVTKMAEMAGYHTPVWYSTRAITNILALSNVIKQYRVTYDSDERKFVVHREARLENILPLIKRRAA
jgi:uncharacterized protein YodC (DUF2158 family)